MQNVLAYNDLNIFFTPKSPRMTHHYTQHYIDGRWQTAHDDKVFDVHDASTEEVMATVPQGTAEEAAQAVMAARKAFPAWSGLSVDARCEYIDKIVAGLKARTDEMGLAIAREVGMPLKQIGRAHV